jgi:hypothetical protein
VVRCVAARPPERCGSKELSSYPWDIYEKDVLRRRKVFESTPVEKTFYGLTLPLLRHLINTDKSVQSVVDIGCYYVYVSHRLAQEFPYVQIKGVDFPQLLPKINAEFSLPNLEIISGYALELMEAGKLKGDLYWTCSTATRFKNLELKRYLAGIKKYGKYFVINEPLLPRPGLRIVHPDSVSPDESLPVFGDYDSDDTKWPPVFIHNYKAICERMGFSVPHYRVYIPDFATFPSYRIEMVAKC